MHFQHRLCPAIFYVGYQQVFVSDSCLCRRRHCPLQLESTLTPSLISLLKSIKKWRCSCGICEDVSWRACDALTVAAKSYNHIIKALKSNFLFRFFFFFSLVCSVAQVITYVCRTINGNIRSCECAPLTFRSSSSTQLFHFVLYAHL